MTNKKTIGILVCIFLIGASVIPSISGQIGNTTNEKQVNFYSNEDFIDAYWMFDECSGNTIVDSSEHGYDGSIYGATWESHDSGCALNFDGLDDYVDLDEHSQYGLGFNKSDDAIFSFYFRSTSTDNGVIYSICRGDAYGYNPGFHIGLASNGSIEVKVWRVNCGIWMYSNENFNDDSWHFVEIFYNGETANPTVEIYIDNQLEKSQKRWVCYFYDDQFHHADFGRNSYDFTDYYKGRIDEFKIINYPGGNEQYPPIIDGPAFGVPNVEYDYTFTIDDPERDDCEINIDFEGTQTGWLGPFANGEVVTVSHTWPHEGNFNITSKSRDRWGEGPWGNPFNVIIGNHPPDAPTVDGPASGKPNTNYEFILNSVDPDGDNVRFHVDWGDGETDITSFVSSGTDVSVSHSWSEKGEYTVTIYAEDEYGLISEEIIHIFVVEKSKSVNNPFLNILQKYPKILQMFMFLLQH